MTLKKIYIVRHGETDYNKRNMVQGRGIDASLNETGRQQAESFYQAYKNTSFDKLYISMLKRTNESMAGFIRDGLPFERMAGFDEISWGNQEGVPFSEESHTLYQETTKRWQAGDLTANVGGGENPVQVMERQKQAMDIVLSRSAEKQILICMHGRAMRILLSWLLNYDLSHMDNFEHQNLGLYVLTYTGEHFRIDQHNNTDHLG